MEAVIGGETYTFCRDIRENDRLRRSFEALARRTFSLEYETWYEAGFWRDSFAPHALLLDGEVVSNISVSTLDFMRRGKVKRLVQLGTVMTDKSLRGRGLSRFLMERVLAEYLPRSEGVYLYGNNSVLNFYPRFGFVPAEEHIHTLPLTGGGGGAVPLSMESAADRAQLLRAAARGDGYTAVALREPEMLLMYYCLGPMRAKVWALPAFDAVLIAEQRGEDYICYEVFGGGAPLAELLAAAAAPETRRVILGFTPAGCGGMTIAPLREENSTFFWHASKPLPFDGLPERFPELSRT